MPSYKGKAEPRTKGERGTGYVGDDLGVGILLQNSRQIADDENINKEEWENTYDFASGILTDFEVYDSFMLYAIVNRID